MQKKMVNWKVIAIIFIVLFLVENLVLTVIYYFNIQESKCSEYCSEDGFYEYHPKTSLCLCKNGYEEITRKVNLKNLEIVHVKVNQ